MRTWARAVVDQRCGFCGNGIRRGAPLFAYTFPEVKAAKVRCVTCAGEPAPVDLPELDPLPAIKSEPMQPKRFTPVKVLAFDWKAKQAGDDHE